MDLGGAPQWVLKAHSSDQIAYLFSDVRAAPARMGLPSPIGGKALAMPTHHRLGPHDGYGFKDVRAATIKPDEQSPV
jgi:hypothetical protein